MDDILAFLASSVLLIIKDSLISFMEFALILLYLVQVQLNLVICTLNIFLPEVLSRK